MTTVLLDVDGTLVDSNIAHAEAWAQAFAKFGYSFSSRQIFPLIGMGGDKLVAALVPDIDPEKSKKVARTHSEIFLRAYVASLKPTRGARELLIALRERRDRLIVASSAHKNELEALLKAGGISDLIEETVTSDDVESSKPDPDLVEEALRKSEAKAQDAVMLGDTPYDVEAAHRAGVRIIALRCGGRTSDDPREADAIYDDPADLLTHIEETPL